MSYGVYIYKKELIENFIKSYPKTKKILEEEGDWFDGNLVIGFDSNLDDEPYDIIMERLKDEISWDVRDEFAYKLSKKNFEYGG
jgi:hypothetical protein